MCQAVYTDNSEVRSGIPYGFETESRTYVIMRTSRAFESFGVGDFCSLTPKGEARNLVWGGAQC